MATYVSRKKHGWHGWARLMADYEEQISELTQQLELAEETIVQLLELMKEIIIYLHDKSDYVPGSTKKQSSHTMEKNDD